MADVITARQDDTLDGLIWRERGLGMADAPAILAANPGIAALGAILPAGTKVTVPAVTTPAVVVRDVVQLWD